MRLLNWLPLIGILLMLNSLAFGREVLLLIIADWLLSKWPVKQHQDLL